MSRILRPYQIDSLDRIRKQLRSGIKRVVLSACCGYGKTTVASEMIACALEKGKRSVFIVDRLQLLDQASARLDEENIPHGIIQGNHWRSRPYEMVQVASIQTLARRRIPDFNLGIIDEVHVLYKTHKKIMEQYNNVTFIGLSATPFSKGLGKYFESLVTGATINELIDLKYLVEPTVYSCGSPDTRGIKIVKGEFEEKAASKATNKPNLIADIVDTWHKLSYGFPTLVFAYNIAHSKLICKDFVNAGVRAEHIDCYLPDDVKADKIRRHKSGEITVLVNVGMLDKGYDYPDLSCIVDAALNRSLIKHIQKIGRLIRASKNKLGCNLHDHAGNTNRIFELHGVGFITDDLPTELDTGQKEDKKKKEKKEKLSKKCRGTIVIDGVDKFCGFDKPPGVHKCPKCGFAPQVQSNIETEDGELVIINKKKYTLNDRIRWYGELKQYAYDKKFINQSGWCAHQFKNKFKVWPNDQKIKDAEPIEPSRKVLNYITYQFIKYNKGKKKGKKLARV